MALTDQLKKTSVAVSMSGIVSAGALFAFLDTRYALGSDVQMLIQTIQDDRVERLEFEIDECDRAIKYLKLIPEQERTIAHEMELDELERRREMYIRKLERITQ